MIVQKVAGKDTAC